MPSPAIRLTPEQAQALLWAVRAGCVRTRIGWLSP